MTPLLVALPTALWLGLVTSVSPCPLATNVAATSVLIRQLGHRGRALVGVVAYTLGRIAVYLALALVLSAGLTSQPALAAFLRREVPPLVGPVLILAGLAVLGWLPLPVSWRAGGEAAARRLAGWGLAGEFGLGALFALSFCPVSAALFFGSLLPLALASPAPFLPVAVYGLGTALPVGLVAVLLVFSATLAARTVHGLQSLQKVAVLLTGWVLLAVGVWLTVTATF